MDMLCKVGEVWKKGSFYDELKCEWAMHSASDLVMCLMDMLVGISIDLMGFMEGMV